MLSLKTLSGRRYRVAGRLPPPLEAEFLRRLADRRFLPLSPSEEATYGWTTADNLLLTDFDAGTLLRGEHVVLGLRIDRRRVNARLLRARLDLSLRAHRKAAEDAGKPGRLSRDERLSLRRDLEEELRRETSPTVGHVVVLLHPRRRVLHVLSRSRTVNEIAVKLVRDTFGVDLAPLTPYARAGEILAGEETASRLDALDRTEFARRHPAPPPVERTREEVAR